MADVVADAAGVDASSVTVAVEESAEEVPSVELVGNLTLDSDISAVNETATRNQLASLYNVSASLVSLELSAGSVRVAYSILVPTNCTLDSDLNVPACEEDGTFGGGAITSADEVLSTIAAVDASALTAALGVPVTIDVQPKRRERTRKRLRVRIRFRIRVNNETEAAAAAAILNGGSSEDALDNSTSADGNPGGTRSIFRSQTAMQAALAGRGLSIKVRGKPSRPLTHTVASSGQIYALNVTIFGPETSFPLTLDPGSLAVIPVAAHGYLYTLLQEPVFGHPTLQYPVPRARSYDGQPWERVEPTDCREQSCMDDKAFLRALERCGQRAKCTVRVPKDKTGGSAYSFVVNRYSLAAADAELCAGLSQCLDDADRAASRLLIQATFGPTRPAIASLGAAMQAKAGRWAASASAIRDARYTRAARDWVDAQMDQAVTPPTLHRAYYRARVNPRMRYDYDFVAGVVPPPCAAGSRWSRYAFRGSDYYSPVTIYRDDDGVTTVMVDNEVRTRLADDSPWGLDNAALSANEAQTEQPFVDTNVTHPWRGFLCQTKERKPSGDFVFLHSSQTCKPTPNCGPSTNPTKVTNCRLQWYNPPVNISDADQDNIPFVEFAEADLDAVATLDGGVVVTAFKTACTLTEPTTTHAVMRYNGTFFLHDPRLKLIENTLDTPANTSGSGLAASDHASCPSVPKTFVNAKHCVRTEACAPITYTATSFVLNSTTLRTFYVKGAVLLYEIMGLRAWTCASATDCTADIDSPCPGSSASSVSRWRVVAPSDCAPGGFNVNNHAREALDDATRQAFVAAIEHSTDVANPQLRDVTLSTVGDLSCSATNNGVSSVGAMVVDGNGTCWEHVHSDLHSVYMAGEWALIHDGNQQAGYDVISPFAVSGGTQLPYPSNHPMSRWSSKKKYFDYVGRLGDLVDFASLPSTAQAPAVAVALGAGLGARAAEGFEVCGSAGEVPNDPALEHRYTFGIRRIVPNGRSERELRSHMMIDMAKVAVNNNVQLTASDQLRQRVAWAASQLWVISDVDLARRFESELFHTYHDIFVRHAFGNMIDILREVSYSPVMGDYLTFRNARAFSVAGNAPDENYARELMQLFTIGLFQLKPDGSYILDGFGNPIATYDTINIMTFARAWTGFDRQPFRANLESLENRQSANRIDPMRVKGEYRDGFPKVNLYGGHLGDGVPLCNQLPERAFLRKGATYRYIGRYRGPEMDAATRTIYFPKPSAWLQPSSWGQAGKTNNGRQALMLDPALSSLHRYLCKGQVTASYPGNSADGQVCTFPSEVVLDSNLVCHGSDGSGECDVETVLIVEVYVKDGSGAIVETVWYEYLQVPCVELTFFSNGRHAEYGTSNKNHALWMLMCMDPTTRSAAPACCSNPTGNENTKGDSNGQQIKWRYYGELSTYAAAAANCAASQRPHLCDTFSRTSGASGNLLAWQSTPCRLQVQVSAIGLVLIVQPDLGRYGKVSGAVRPWFSRDSNNWFVVRWVDGIYPQKTADGQCTISGEATTACEVHGETCVCDIEVSAAPVFTAAGVGGIPSQEQLERSLSIGSVPPSHFDAGEYIKCTSAPCQAAAPVEVFTHHTSGGAWDEKTVFGVLRNGTRRTYLRNLESTVSINGSSANCSFRNPPRFNKFGSKYGPQLTSIDAMYETEELLQHLFYHQNTAPFVAYRFIQRLTTSNPSPRYLAAVSKAFRTGRHGGRTFSGRHGDMGAMVAAIMLDREARSATLELDPHHGLLREPHLRVMHLLRAFEFRAKNDEEVELQWMDGKIGMMPKYSETVFNFYMPEYLPQGVVGDTGLVSPEMTLANGPFIIGLLNGVTSLINHGLGTCENGFRTGSSGPWVCAGDGAANNARGAFTYTGVGGLQSVLPSLDASRGSEPTGLGTVSNPGNLLGLCKGDCDSDWECDGSLYCFKRSGYEPVPGCSGFGRQGWDYCTKPSFATGAWNYTSELVSDLSLLLTAGRLAAPTRAIVAAAHDSTLQATGGSSAEALKVAQQLVSASAEYAVTNAPGYGSKPRPPPRTKADPTREYRAIVMVFLNGGLDSFNLIVPHSGCKNSNGQASDYYAEYSAVRTISALPKGELQPISTLRSPREQPCTTMGLHPSLTKAKELYESGQALVYAGIGPLIEYITKEEYNKRLKRKPASLFAHNVQTRIAESLNPREVSAKGVLGRLLTAMETLSPRVNAVAYSVTGSRKVLEGGPPPEMLHQKDGVVRYARHGEMMSRLSNMSDSECHSVFAEAFNAVQMASIRQAEILGKAMGNQTLSQVFSSEDGLSEQLSQVAKVIKARHSLKGERDVFVVSLGRFDSHNTITDKAFLPLQQLNNALSSFVEEMRNEGVWDNVAMPIVSEFGRTITSNGAGTDHAWAGNTLLLGGALNGSRILGDYPQGLGTDADVRISRGRLIPTTPFESLWQPIAEWFGLPDEQMDAVLPLRGNFGRCVCPSSSSGCSAAAATAAEDAGGAAQPPVIRRDACVGAGFTWIDDVLHENDVFVPAAVRPRSPPPPLSPPAPPPVPVTDPAECQSEGDPRCCVVLFKGSAGAQCSPVPIWDFASWNHPGGAGSATAAPLCGKVRYGWLSKGSHSSQSANPEMGSTLDGGAVKVGQYTDPNC